MQRPLPAYPPRAEEAAAAWWLLLLAVLSALLPAVVAGGLFALTGATPTSRAGAGDVAKVVPLSGVAAYDPAGGDGEHDERAPQATDGIPATYWGTENYGEPQRVSKPGVGVVLDAGGAASSLDRRLRRTRRASRPYPGRLLARPARSRRLGRARPSTRRTTFDLKGGGPVLRRLDHVLGEHARFTSTRSRRRAEEPSHMARAAEERSSPRCCSPTSSARLRSASSQDPERTRALLDRFYDAMAEEVEHAGGTVEKFAGDAVMAAFGAPAALEDHAERALHAALAMRGGWRRC